MEQYVWAGGRKTKGALVLSGLTDPGVKQLHNLQDMNETIKCGGGITIELDRWAPNGNRKLAWEIMKKLTDLFPYHDWSVRVDDKKTVGIAAIYLGELAAVILAPAEYGWLLHLPILEYDRHLSWVKKAGADLLNRANLPSAGKGDLPKYIEGVKDKHQPLLHQLTVGRN